MNGKLRKGSRIIALLLTLILVLGVQGTMASAAETTEDLSGKLVIIHTNFTKANPKNVATLNFLAGEELYENARKQVAELTKYRVDYIICVAHLGIDEESAPNRSVDIIENVKGIDLVIDGHSHSVVKGYDDAETILVQAGTKLSHVGVVIMDKESISTKLISASEYSKVDNYVNNRIIVEAAKIDEMLSDKFAITEVFLDGNRDPGVRTKETNLGDFAADAILWAANKAVGGGVDASITNGGGIRASIEIGDVTMKDMKTVFPFGNTISVVKLTGAQLLEILEASTSSSPLALGAFPQVAGLQFTIDTTVPYENGEQYPDSTYYAPANPGARVKNVKVNGKALELDKTYTIATNDFLAAGGDTYYILKNLESFNTNIALEDALIDYTTEVLNGVISTDKYGQSKGRINFDAEPVTNVTEELADVETGNVVEELVDPVTDKDPEKVVKKETEESSVKNEVTTDNVIYYTVVKGDCLWKIAKKHLGSGARYNEIYELNKDVLKSPDKINVGQVLKIPA